jgi:hypothetical protein
LCKVTDSLRGVDKQSTKDSLGKTNEKSAIKTLDVFLKDL